MFRAALYPNFLTTFTRLLLKTIAVFAISANVLYADSLPIPMGDVVLTVSGDIALTNIDGTAQFDLAGLQALGTTEVVTSTVWTEGVNTFQGISLHDLLETLGAQGTILKSFAINDYTIEVPVSDAVEGGPILAYKMNGREMSVRDKGPIWLIYPYDSSSDYRTDVVYLRSIWQLTHIEVLP